LILSGGQLNLGGGNYLFAGNTVVNDPGTRASVFGSVGLIDSNVFVSDQAVKLETLTGAGVGNYSRNRLVGYTKIADGESGTDYYDLGDNKVIESPYRNWQNLDFTVVRPGLLEISDNSLGGIGPKTYAGCFTPTYQRLLKSPFLRQT